MSFSREDTGRPVRELTVESNAEREAKLRSGEGGDGETPLIDEAAEEDVKLAGAKLVGGLLAMEHNEVGVERNSVYGAAVLAPQLARSLGWPRELTALTITSYIYLFLCVIIHGWLLVFIDKEERIMDKFSGQMFLCDFGAGMDSCDNSDCTGPGGTKMTPPRLYSWAQWATRNFVRDSLTALFPDRKDEIMAQVDPGEYGVESYMCRLVCCILFVISIVPEMKLCVHMAKLLWYVPPVNQAWLCLNKDIAQLGNPNTWLEEVRVQVAGMSRLWKFVNFTVVFLPKCILVLYTAKAGVSFLMETAGVDDIIVNSVALSFLLGLDELMTAALMGEEACKLLEMCEGLELDHAGEGALDEDVIVSRFADDQRLSTCESWLKALVNILYYKLYNMVIVLLILGFMVGNYYYTNCEWHHGRLVSKAMYLPKSTDFTVLNAFFRRFFPVEHEEEPYWKMPEPAE
eukprot:TRINITY_DN40542_c0_g1_i1.p1 TRINITY_DN40542_c0_g1~~TRINITY_DN40542_c0_g1_i1.p1  ORF type:complete len:459 (-),score=68.09 TRINITY_DN40542_c0_g1_i1:10-1386(-)